MIVKETSNTFTPHPAGQFHAVCVDITPLKAVESTFGKREVFKFTFETEAIREDGTPFCAWSRNMTASLHEKSNLRKFIKQWLGRDLSGDELRGGFDTESLLHKPALLVITQEEVNGSVYANVVAIMPDKSKEPLQPSGKYVRVQDRPPKDAAYSRTSTPAAQEVAHTGWRATVVHVGANKGRQLGDLSEAQLQALYDKWLPQLNESASEDDIALKHALEECFDDIPY